MKLHETGVILFTKHYDSMVTFYRDIIGLPARAEKPEFHVFHFGYGYLMIEPFVSGHSIVPGMSGTAPFVLRFNVFDIAVTVQSLRDSGVDVSVKEFEWGTIASFYDPDGNLIELKDAPDFFE